MLASLRTRLKRGDDVGRGPSAERVRRWGPRLLVAVAVGFGLWVLRAESTVVQNLNDGSLHAAMVRWATQEFRAGDLPLGGWFPLLTTGWPQFQHYQSTPHLIAGLAGVVFGGDVVYAWSNYLLLATWPISVYAGARMLGADRWAAAGAGLVSPLVASQPGYGYEHGSYVFAGLGVWSQLWGMWMLPLALGVTWRAVEERRRYARAAIVLGVTVVFHFLTGYFAVLALGAWVVARRQVVRRGVRAAIIAGGAMAVASWRLVPVLVDREWVHGGEFLVGFWRDSFGARQVFGWLVTGRLFDRGRLPVVTLLVAVGVVVCVVRSRRDPRARALLALWLLALFLFSGRPTFGFLIDRLPGGSELLFHRYIIAVHIAGILLAGVGAAWLGRLALSAAARVPVRIPRPAVVAAVLVVGVVALWPAWAERGRYGAFAADLARRQALQERLNGAPIDALIEEAKERGGRTYAGLPTNWGKDVKVGFVPVYSVLLNRDAEALGFTMRVSSIVTNVEARFDDSSPRMIDTFGISHYLLPRSRKPPAGAELVRVEGNHALWSLPAASPVAVVDTVGSVEVERKELGEAMVHALATAPSHVVPTVGLDGRDPAEPTADRVLDPGPGRVVGTKARPAEGVFDATVELSRPGAVVLRSSFHPRWTVTVDGRSAEPYMVAPGFVAVTVDEGRHDVRFRFEPFGDHLRWLLLGVVALVVLRRLGRGGRVAAYGRSRA